ncbi:amino acid adenylation domain-containing protein, partial [Rhodanobacter sp. K2T2]|nr:amino acid adenylation domain-containing protein [Rhodanobacter sp. K2T2]
HQDLPFEQVVEIAQPPRRLDHTPLFQVMFAWQPSSWTITDMTGIEVEAMPTGNGTCRFDLELILQEDGSEVRGILNHATSLYDVSTMQRHVDYLMTVLRAMTVDGASLSSIDMLSEAERAQQTAWNATEAPYPSDTGIHALIEAQVRRTPEAIAVRQGDDTLTYAELDRKANRLACRLLEHGLQHGEVVAVCLARTLDLVVAYLGILKAGGAYLPLDPSHPASRLSQTLDDAMVRVVLVDPAGLAAFAETSLHGRLALNVGQDNGDASITFTPRNIDARDLAYVIYTSGSTGRPKGVMIEHRSLVALTAWHCQAFDLRPGMFASAMAGLAFDASTWEIWPTLVSGGCLLFPPAASLGDLQAMLRWWIGSPTQIGFLTTSLATTVLAEGDYPPQLETLLIGGDRYNDSSASLPRGLRLVNNYGPTETTVVATSGDIDTATGRSTIGRAIANTRIHILDKHGHSVPCGTVGEMYIGGVGVARGYLGNAELTDERFIHDRFSANPGERLYRTGDLARFLPDGSLAFHGRNDDQVKIRGYRVEPGEIEACLKSHPWVQDAVVVTRSDAVGTLVLVAFVVGTSGHDVLVDELAWHARSHLPSYMIPAAILLLDGLPMTANGKVDRRALPSTELTLSSMPEGDVPEPGLELLVATAWAGLLDGVKIARQTDFFESGGHSLLALRFVGMLGRELGVDIPMSALFAHPRLIDFAAALAPLLAPDQRHEHASTVIERRTDSLPLASFAQQAMWLTSQTEHGHAASHIVAVLRFSGDLNTQALRATLNTIYARHDALRTTFVFRAGALVAKVLPAGEDFPLAEIDLAANGYDEAGLAAVLARESGRRFDLASGPLVRACLVRTSDHEHVFQLALHHIVCDGGSMDILVRDIEQLYLANVTGQIASLDQPLLRYVDFAAWESEQWSTGHLATQARYWTFLLRDAPPTIALPTDRAPLAVRTHPARQSAVCIPQACVERLNNVARRHGTTLFATVLAAWWAVLARLSGQSDIVIGTPSSQRRRPEIANVVGLLVNTLPLRIVADEDATLAEVVEQAARATRDALDHQDVPYDKVVEMLRSEGRDAQASLFQVMISWQGAMRVPPLLPGLAVEIVDMPETFLRYDLELDLREEGGAVVGALGYDAELFDEARIARHLGYFQRMLAALAGDDQARYAQVDILDVAERESLLGEAIGGGLSSNLPSGIHRVVEDQALRDGSAVAIMDGDVHLTYLELDARANRFARYLSGLAPIHGRPVAICMERCADMIVAVLAVLKAGGFYVPIDSNYPAQRIADIIEDARPDIVVTDARHRAQLSTVVPMVAMDGMPRPWDACPATPLDERTTSPHDLAYVIYTSGSTGIPKGVMVEHASVVRQIETVRRTYELGSADRYLQFSSLAFDVSVEEIFGALSSGACLVLRTDESISSPQAFDAFCNTHAITIASLPTAFWSGMVSHWASPGRGLPSNLSRIVIGGEAVSAPALKAWFAIGHHLPRVFNAYGPTETTINATIRRVDASGAWHSIGKVVDHGRLYLLDRHRSLVPMGTVGEIHVGGDILARGYHGRPALTAERFVADPFRATGDARMYRTGDLARRLPDGEIEYLGRNDNQVQIRGHRVELGEIEAVLGDCAWVDQVMVDVVAHNDQSERIAPRIVAYVEASSTGHALSEPLPAILKSYLATRLPSYMLPSVFVAVATWPLTVNGKIDKARLPSIEEADVGSAPFEEPQGVVEQAIAAIWRDLLGLSVVGRHAGFFEIGGHSLLAVQMLGRVCDRFGCSVAMSRLFAAPTVALLAEEVNFAAMSNEEASVDEASELGLRLTSAQQRLWLLEAGADVGSSYHMPVACRLHGALDIHAFRKSLDRLYARHDVLRTVITEQDGLPVVSLLDASMGCPLAISHVTRANTEAIAELCLEEYGRPFDLSCEPPLRAALIGLPDGDHLFLLTLHHLVADATTLHIVMSELSALYAAAPEGGSDPLPPVVATSFDHAMWEARWSRSSARRVAVDYWKGVLVGSPPALDLPLDRPRMARREHEAAFVPIVLDKTLTSGLRELARRSGATVFMAMLGAWSVVLSRLASQSDIVIGTPVSSRTRAMWEDTVGCFVNTLPLRINLHDASTPQTLIERVRDTTLAAFDHAQLPFEAILAASGAVRHAEISPLFQVMFVWEQNADALPELAGLTVERIDVDYASSKFDLELVLSDRGDTIEGGLNFATALFDRSTITQHVGYLLTVLSEMVRDASQPLGTLRLLATDEYHELIEHLNATTAVYPEGRCLHELFELQVARVPQAHAL